MESFAKKIKELRVAAGLSQEKLAKQLGTTVKSIQRYEGGYRSDTYALVKLATFFDVSADYLLGLKGYKEQMEERKHKLKGEDGYNELYSHYLKCLNNYEITEDAEYYWIELKDDYIGGQTQWVGWADNEYKLEIRRLRPVKPKGAIEACMRIIEKPMVINSQLDAAVFLIYGGQAIVRADICEQYLPEFMEDFITENPEVKVLRELEQV
jgi:transcriptional regulator with XRE-family HTH domain